MKRIIVALVMSLFYSWSSFGQKVFQKHSSVGSLTDSAIIRIFFTPGSVHFTPTARRKLQNLSASLDTASSRRIVVAGGSGSDYASMQASWDQTNNVIEYLCRHSHFKREKFIFSYDGFNDVHNTVIIRYAKPGETGEAFVAPVYLQTHRK